VGRERRLKGKRVNKFMEREILGRLNSQ